MRKPAVAGQFYAGSFDALKEQIERCYNHKLGPKNLPKLAESPSRKIKGLMVPHAGYPYSGPIAAHSYLSLAQDGFPESFIILGPNHTGSGSMVALTTEDFSTPLGDVKVDQKLAKRLHKDIIDNDIMAHIREHSIEVQLPFLQHISKKFKFVPISLSLQDFKTDTTVGEIISEAVGESDVVITHCGFMYGQPPAPGMTAGAWADRQDKKVIKSILELDTKALIRNVRQFDITMCGYGPVIAMLTAAKNLGAESAELLKYASSYDIQPADSAVGYAAIRVE